MSDDALIRMLRGSRDEALDAAMKEAHELYRGSVDAGDPEREFGTVLLKCDDGSFRYAQPNAGKAKGAWETRAKIPQGCGIDSVIHTHPYKGVRGPSEHDREVAKQLKVPSYVVTGSFDGTTTQVHEINKKGGIKVRGK